MLMTVASRVAARALIAAALAAGSLSLAVTAAGACTGPAACGGGPSPVTASLTCTTPDCTRGLPPAAAALECTDPRCVSGTPPASVHAGPATTTRSGPRFQPCPCDKPICRPGC